MHTGKLQPDNIVTQPVKAAWLQEKSVELYVLRLDKIHAVVSGNKWFKLKHYLQDAVEKQCKHIATFGGAWSNHIVATAYAAMQQNLSSTGIIRGEEPAIYSNTLQQAKLFGMQLHFVSREAYRNKELIKRDFPGGYFINEGGYGPPGAKGAAEILEHAANPGCYTHIFCAVGTGTMLAGLSLAVQPHQQLTGISVLKNNTTLYSEVLALSGKNNFTILHDYSFGGYARHTPQLLAYMTDVWNRYHVPTDIVYTSKTFYAIEHLVTTNQVPKGAKILMVHSGGLQGNLSLPAGALPFL